VIGSVLLVKLIAQNCKLIALCASEMVKLTPQLESKVENIALTFLPLPLSPACNIFWNGGEFVS